MNSPSFRSYRARGGESAYAAAHAIPRRRTSVPIWAWFLVLALAVVALPRLAAAQALDELRYIDRDKDAVLQIHFNVRVQMQNYAPQVASDIFEVYFQLLGGDESAVRPSRIEPTEEFLSTPDVKGRPQAEVIYPVQPAEKLKKVVVRLDRVVTFRVRPGADNQTLEVVLPGLALQPVTVPVASTERNRYAIALQTVPLAQRDAVRAVPQRFQNYAAFGSQRRVGGADVYEVDLGFFDTAESAEAVRRDAAVEFPQAVVFDVAQRKEESLRAAPAAPPAPAPAPASSLAPSLVAPLVAAAAVPVLPAVAAASTAASAAGGTAAVVAAAAPTPSVPPALSGGANAPVAEPATAAAPAAASAAASPAASPAATPAVEGLIATPAGPRVEGAVPMGPGAVATRLATAAEATELERNAGDLMKQAREALASGRNAEAVPILNQLLLLPPNRLSQDAQELIGLARERSGEPAQARQEYELYLRLFPEGDGARRVRQRLASLAPPEQATTVAAKPKEKREPTLTWGGSLAQSYYGGNAATQTAFTNVPTLASQQSITNNTQSSMITSVDLNARYRTETNDTRVVVRDTEQKSFLLASPSINRLDAAYVDYHNEDVHGSVRVGRQAGVTGGLVGRFDGVALSYDLPNKMRIGAVAGNPVDKLVGSTQRFEGVNLEAQNFAEHWGASGFLINQSADGVVDRRAVGGELRYFAPNRSLYTLVDYDVNFHALNAVTLQGNYQLPDQTNVSVLVDDRKAPTLATSNGLIQFGCNTFPQAYAGNCSQPGVQTLDTLRQSAIATTAEARQAAIDISRPITTHWTASADIRLTNVGRLPTVVVNGILFPGTDAGTGNVMSGSLQATGSNLYSKRDISVFSITHLQGPIYRGEQFSMSNLNSLMNNLVTLEPNLSYYHQRDTTGGTTGQTISRIAPGLHGSYKVAKRVSVDSTISTERSRSDGPTQNSTTRNTFFYIGYRLDLN